MIPSDYYYSMYDSRNHVSVHSREGSGKVHVYGFNCIDMGTNSDQDTGCSLTPDHARQMAADLLKWALVAEAQPEA